MKPTNLEDHPEGGKFRQIFKSTETVITEKNITRSALTHIYFSLTQGEVSKFHKVSSDEVWNLYQGEGVVLYLWEGRSEPPKKVVLSVEENQFCFVVPANVWQAAEPLAESVLVGCSVAPGFEYDDFTLIDPQSEEAQSILSLDNSLTRFINI